MKSAHTIPKDIIATYLPKNPTIIEAGAHIGRDTAKLAKQFPNGTIYAFEPVSELFEQLQKNVADYSNVFIFNTALSDEICSKKFYKSGGRSTATSSLFEPKEYAKEFPTTTFEETTVQCTTLNNWAKENGIKKIDFMWLDMQGGELDALKGATDILPSITAIYTEVALTERYKDNPLYDELKNYLSNFGFVVEQEALGKGTWGNVLFCRK
jgi:FkbM family methyltransferase